MNRVPQRANYFYLWIIGILLVFNTHVLAEELIKVDKALKQIFPTASSFEEKTISLSEEQIKDIEKNSQLDSQGVNSDKAIVYCAKEEGVVLGYVLEDTVMGKWGPIHYLLGVDVEGKVIQVVILDHKEIRGRPIAKKRFLRQYQGKTIRDKVQLSQDIDGITGATISSRSLTDGVRKLLHIFELVKSSVDFPK